MASELLCDSKWYLGICCVMPEARPPQLHGACLTIRHVKTWTAFCLNLVNRSSFQEMIVGNKVSDTIFLYLTQVLEDFWGKWAFLVHIIYDIKSILYQTRTTVI